MSATILPFKRKPQSPTHRHDAGDVFVFAVEDPETGRRVQAVTEEDAASKLGLSPAELRRQRPVQPVEGSDGQYYSVDDVAAEMVRRGIPVGKIESVPHGAA